MNTAILMTELLTGLSLILFYGVRSLRGKRGSFLVPFYVFMIGFSLYIVLDSLLSQYGIDLGEIRGVLLLRGDKL